MNAPEIINECRAHGLQIFLSNGALKANGAENAIKRFVPILKLHKLEIERYLIEQSLRQFCFDQVHDEVESGCSGELLNRVNNMTWEFMQSDGMEFSDAIMVAAEIVLNCPVAPCEAAYVDAMALFKRLSFR